MADEVDAVLREGSNQRQAEAEYETPAGDKRFFESRFRRFPPQMAACSASPA